MEYTHSSKGVLGPDDRILNGYDHAAASCDEAGGDPEPIRPDPVQCVDAGITDRPKPGYRQESPPEVLDLLHRAQAGDTEAFADLYRTNVSRVTRYVAARMRERDLDAVPDLVQDAFCEAFADLPSAHHDVTGWLLTQAAKACIRHDWSTRRYVRAAKTIQAEMRDDNAQPTTAAEKTAGVGHNRLVHALARLATDQRRAMQLRFLDGLPRQVRAEELDRSLEAIKSLEQRALRNLRASLARTAMNGATVIASAAHSTTHFRS